MIKLVVFDFDGVFTDGKCCFDSETISKSYDVKDGKAIGLLRDSGMQTALLSAYRTELDRKILLNQQSIDEAIATHLKFDLVSIGNGNKLDILTQWLEDLKIGLSEVAYIGDDLADLEVLKRVGLSGCPADAIAECREVSEYVCQKNGGEGCVREFVEYVLRSQKSVNRTEAIVREIRTEVNYQLDSIDVSQIERVANLIRACEGNIYFTGIGKSRNIALECCILLKSVNIRAFALDAVECLHGDVGTLRSDDIVIMFSKSGNTVELVELVEILKHKECATIGVCCDPNSKFEKICSYTVKLPLRSEISGNITKIPTNSYMSQLLFSNILVSLLKEDITLDDYKVNHLGGNIGKHLESIGKKFKTECPKFIFNDSTTAIPLYDIIMEMTRLKIGCAFFVDSDGVLIGILTDGDIRRMYLTKVSETITIDLLNKDYYFETDLNKLSGECRKLSFIPIVDDNRHLLGICDMLS